MTIIVSPGVTFTWVVTITSKVLGWLWGITYNGLLKSRGRYYSAFTVYTHYTPGGRKYGPRNQSVQ